MTLTGRPNAAAKSKPTHPRPRLYGSAIGQPCRIGPGYPIDTTSYVQPRASFLTPDTICRGVNVGPDGNERSSVCPVARILTEVPPTSTTSTFPAADVFATSARSRRRRRRSAAGCDFAFTALARSLEHGGFGADHTHQLVPRLDEGLGTFVLKLSRQRMDVYLRIGEPCQLLFGVAAVRRERCADVAVVSQGFQRALGHGVHREWRGQALDVEDIRSLDPWSRCWPRAGAAGARRHYRRAS